MAVVCLDGRLCVQHDMGCCAFVPWSCILMIEAFVGHLTEARTPSCSPEIIVVMIDPSLDVTIGVEFMGGDGDVVEESSTVNLSNSNASGGDILFADGRLSQI